MADRKYQKNDLKRKFKTYSEASALLPEDKKFLEKFFSQQYSEEEWNHAAHIRLAFCCLKIWPHPKVAEVVKEGILALNKSHGIVESPMRGYHETLTQAWIRIVMAAPDCQTATSFSGFMIKNKDLTNSSYILKYYSKEYLKSPQARQSFINPDKMPLP